MDVADVHVLLGDLGLVKVLCRETTHDSQEYHGNDHMATHSFQILWTPILNDIFNGTHITPVSFGLTLCLVAAVF